MVIAYLKGWFLDWRTVAWMCNAYSIIPCILIMFIPESPAWLVSKGKIEEAAKSLNWINKNQPQPENKVKLHDFLKSPSNWALNYRRKAWRNCNWRSYRKSINKRWRHKLRGVTGLLSNWRSLSNQQLTSLCSFFSGCSSSNSSLASTSHFSTLSPSSRYVIIECT